MDKLVIRLATPSDLPDLRQAVVVMDETLAGALAALFKETAPG
jgi:hypothetical protein